MMTNQSMENNLAVVTLHDAAPAFSKRIFKYTDAFENLEIDFNAGPNGLIFDILPALKSFCRFSNSSFFGLALTIYNAI
jgi:hypothetical protein